jgi:CBS domain-containing protein
VEDVTKHPTPPPIDTTGDATLSERVDAVERLLLELIEHNAQEVRTRRVAVIEDDGFERVVLGANGTHGEVTVTAREGRNAATAAELYAHDPTEGDGSTAGIALVRDGDLQWTRDLLSAPGGADQSR